METSKETIDLYPLRPSELVCQPDFLEDIEPLSLTEEQKQEVLEFEKPFFAELKRVKDVSVSTNTIYPEAFMSEEGARLFSAVYLDKNLKDRLEALAAQRGVELEKTKVKRKVYDAFFDDLLDIVGSEDNFQEYQEKGIKLANLSNVLSELGGEGEKPVVLKGEISWQDGLTKKDIEEEFFTEIDLANIPAQLRTRTNRYSSDWAKDQFAQAFREAGGNVEDIANPERIARIVDVDKLIEKVEGLREFKQMLKKTTRELKAKDGDLTEAKRIVVNLYQRYVNVLLAGQYSRGRVLAARPRRTEKDKTALSLIKGTSQEAKSDRFAPERASRTIERIDHFLAGTGVKIGANGLFETLPEKLAEYARARALKSPPQETPEYKKYNGYEVNAQQAQALGELLLRKYDLDKGDKPWSVVVLERKGTLGVSEEKKEFRIPKSFKRSLIDALAVLAHEEEGHVLRHVNQEVSSDKGLRLAEELTTGRSSILSEAAAMRIEDDTKQEMVGVKKETLPYYYLALLKKREGGSFRECFQTFFEAHARRKYSLFPENAIKDKKVYREIFDYAYDRTLRIFKRNTPLGDTSGFLPASGELEYIEQELIVDVLKEKGLGKLLHVAGIDLYSIQELRRLGMLDLSKVKEPRLVMAKEIWPQIKRALDEGRFLEEAIVTLS